MAKLLFAALVAASCYIAADGLGLLTSCAITAGNPPVQQCYVAASCASLGREPVDISCKSGEVCCKIASPCSGITCSGNGVCNAGVCECYDGYNGTDCEVDMCSVGVTNCSANSTCNRLPGPEFYNCTCDPGFSGEFCDVDACENNGQCENGTCLREPMPTLFTCDCDNGFSGPLCNIDACDPDPCAPNGGCNREPNGTYSCTCNNPYFGENCTDAICDILVPCENGGVCTSLTPLEYSCLCALNFTGENCTDTVCIGDRSECNFHGDCVPDLTGNYTCACDDGWSGDNCSISEPLCGVEQLTPRSLNPTVDTEYLNPWTVNMIADSFHWCSGILISNQFVLTESVCAAYCADQNCNITVGDYDTATVESYEVMVEVENITVHPDAVGQTYTIIQANDVEPLLANNLALVKLKTPVTKGQGVNVPCAPKGFDFYKCGSTCKVASFGATASDSFAKSTTKRQVQNARIIEDDICRFHRNYTAMPNGTHCGFNAMDLSGFCFLDFGAGLVCQDPDNFGRWTLEGIVGFRPADTYGAGYGFCTDQIFVYSDVSTYWPWIESMMATM